MLPLQATVTLQLLLMLAVVVIHIQISYVIPLQHITYVSSLTILSGTLLLLSPQDFGQHLRKEDVRRKEDVKRKEDVRSFIVDTYMTPVCRGKFFYIHQ